MLRHPSLHRVVEMVRNKVGSLSTRAYRFGLQWTKRDSQGIMRADKVANEARWMGAAADWGEKGVDGKKGGVNGRENGIILRSEWVFTRCIWRWGETGCRCHFWVASY